MIFVGIDNGVSGAVAALGMPTALKHGLQIWDMPVLERAVTKQRRNRKEGQSATVEGVRREIDAAALRDVFEHIEQTRSGGLPRVAIEAVVAGGAMAKYSGMDVARAAGIAYGMAVAMHWDTAQEIEIVSWTEWRSVYSECKGKRGAALKKAALNVAREEWGVEPYFRREMDHNRAEAALIANWLAIKYDNF